MKVTGIITEYNPMHNGHLLHINKTREKTNCDAIVCVMSGNFVQRGTPAIIDKWHRTKMALMNGVDLVIELPVIFSVSSAEHFAFGSVSLLNNLGVVDSICFGSESGDIDILKRISETLVYEPLSYKTYLKENLSLGHSFPKARNLALSAYFANNLEVDNIINSSNNILGIEYIKSLIKLKSKITPFTISREGSNYNDTSFTSKYSSATSIREYAFNSLEEFGSGVNLDALSDFMPENNYLILKELLSNNSIASPDSMIPYLKYKAFHYANSLSKLPDAKEGLHNLISKNLKECLNFNEVVSQCKSKRYTYTRINRILCQYFIGLDNMDLEDNLKKEAQYARILGFNDTGKKLLSSIKKDGSIPLYTNITKNNMKDLSIESKASYSYSLINPSVNYNSDFFQSPIIIKK